MKKSSFFIKLFLSYLFIIIILSFVIYFFSFGVIKKYYIKNLTKSLRKVSVSLEPGIKPLLVKNKFKKVDNLVKKIGKQINTRITVIYTNGKVIGDSEKNPVYMENHRYRIEVKAALKGKTGTSLRFSKTVKHYMLYVGIPIINNNKIIGVIRSSLFLEDINKILLKIKFKILQGVVVIILFILFFSFLFSRRITKSLNKLVGATKKIANGNFDTAIFLKNNDEFKQLADTFNVMTEKIRDLFVELTYEKNELEKIVSAIPDGLLVVNNSGKIILYNEHIKNFVNENNIKNKYYWEVFSDNELLELISKTINLISTTVELKLRDRYYLCRTAKIEIKNETIFVLHDITDIKKLEVMKKDFIVNVSHELKTPLTAIKGFSETILEMVDDTKLIEYLNIITRHTDRMINIVNDLILLSEVEEQSDNFKFETVNIIEIAKSILKLYENRKQTKKLDFIFEIEDNEILIKGDKFKLEQLFINLIDNAVKYTDSGFIKVKIFKENKLVVVEISDSGIGIPAEELDRIFERFYVVNKARTRETGGTGLGLSIVKHIVQMHNAKIFIESKLNEGTKITIKFPT